MALAAEPRVRKVLQPIRTAVRAPVGTVVPKRPVALTVPALQPRTSYAPPAGDLRGSTVGIGMSPLGSQATDQLSRAMAGLGTSVNIGYRPVGGPNFGQANSYMSQAAAAAGGIRVPGVSAPSLSNLGKTQSALDAARGAYSGLGLKTYGTVAAQDPSQAYAGLTTALTQSHTPGQDELRRIAMGQVRDLAGAPNRANLAARALALQRQMTDPAWQNDLRLAGQKAAALGRIGSGMTTTELSDITLAREKALGQFGEDAALQAAAMEMADRINKLNATAGYQGQISAEDLARAGFTQGNTLARFGVGSTVRGQRVDERNFQAQQAMNQSQIAAARAGGLAGLVGNQYQIDVTPFSQGMDAAQLRLASQQAIANAAAGRASVYGNLGGQSSQNAIASANLASEQAGRSLQARMAQAGERRALVGTLADIQGQQFGQGLSRAQLATQQQGRQDTLAQTAIDNRVRQEQLQEALLQGDFSRKLAGASAAGGIGYSGDPYQMQLIAAQEQARQAAGGRDQSQQAAQAAAMARLLGMY